MTKNTVAIRVGWYGDDELEFRRMAELGFSNIECPLPSTDKVVDLLSRLRRNDLKATTLTVACPIHDDSIFDQMKTAVDIAHQIGVERFFASIHSHGLPWDVLCERLRTVGNIVIIHES